MRKETIRIYWKYIWIFPPMFDRFSYNLECLDFWWFSIICPYILLHWATSHLPLLLMILMSHRLTVVQYSEDHVHGKRTCYRHRCQFWPVKIVWRWIKWANLKNQTQKQRKARPLTNGAGWCSFSGKHSTIWCERVNVATSQDVLCVFYAYMRLLT